MKCPYCGKEDSKVLDSRRAEDGSIRRRRECEQCKRRFTTYEKLEASPILVVKKDGNRQPYDRSKILKGIMNSCVKRPITSEQIESIVDEVEKDIMNKDLKEIRSIDIGEMVLEKLKKVDEVSYIRFASVYRNFKEISNFHDEVTNFNK